MNNKTLNLLEITAQQREILTRSTNAMRLVNGIGDGLDGLILEQYNQHFVAQVFDKKWLAEKETLINFVKNNGGEYFIVKDRTQSAFARPDSFKRSIWIENETSQTVVQENNLKFGVDLDDGLNSGLFLDMRQNRKVIAQLSRSKKVLNCFAYTCSFGVYCRAFGATNVVNVDVSQKSLNRGRANYELNQIIPAKNEFIRADTMDYLQRAIKKNNRFDMIILDPPSFATYQGKNFSVKRDLKQLIDLAMGALNPKGFLFAATNFSGIFSKNLDSIVRAAAAGRRIQKIQHLAQDVDFVGSGLTRLAGKVGQAPESYLAAVLAEI